MVMTGASIMTDAFEGLQLWGELFEVPLMAAMFLAMVWHARRRVDALRIARAARRAAPFAARAPRPQGESGLLLTDAAVANASRTLAAYFRIWVPSPKIIAVAKLRKAARSGGARQPPRRRTGP